jgi:septal ring factor EnvC (AmiA/AmiB activator)
MNSESTNQARKYDALENARGAMKDAGLSTDATNAIMAAVRAAFADVATNDDLTHALETIEAALKAHAKKLSTDDREHLTKLIHDEINELRKELVGKIDGAINEIKELRTDTTAEIKELRTDTTAEIKELRADIVARDEKRTERDEQRSRENRRYWTGIILIGVPGLITALISGLYYLAHLLNLFG